LSNSQNSSNGNQNQNNQKPVDGYVVTNTQINTIDVNVVTNTIFDTIDITLWLSSFSKSKCKKKNKKHSNKKGF